MQKIYLNRETNSVEQIIKEDYDHFENYANETFGDNFYMVIDLENEIDGYNYLYDLGLSKFDRLPMTKPLVKTIVEPNEAQIQINELKEENKLLNDKLDKILNLLQNRGD